MMSRVISFARMPGLAQVVESATVARFIAWRHELEKARTGLGARALTPHVTENDWLAHFQAGRFPVCALLRELVGSAE